MSPRKRKTSSSKADSWPIFIDEGAQKPAINEFLPLDQGQSTSLDDGRTICSASPSTLEIMDNGGQRALILGPYEVRELPRSLKSTLEMSNHFLDLVNSGLVRFL